MKKYVFVGILIAVAAFLLFSLNFGWPGMESGWAAQHDPRPRWFPSAMGGLVSIGTALLAFYLMRRWRS